MNCVVRPEAANNDSSCSKEVKERRARASSTVYTVDAAQKTPVNCMTVSYCDEQSPLSTLNTGRQKNAAAAAATAAATWRYCSVVHGQASPPHHAAAANRRPASNECLRPSDTSSPAEVIIHRNNVRDVKLGCEIRCSHLLQWRATPKFLGGPNLRPSPLPSPLPFFPIPFSFLPLPSLPLKVVPLNTARRVWGAL